MVAGAKKGAGENTGLIWVLLVLLMSSLVLALAAYVTQARHQANVEQYMLLTGEQRVVMHKIASYASESGSGHEAAFERLKQSRNEFSRILDELKNGSSEKALAASPERVQPQLREVESVWLELRSQVDALLNSREAILTARGTIDDVRQILPGLLEILSSVADGLVEGKAPQLQVHLATRQLFVAQRIDSRLNEMSMGGSAGTLAVERLTRDESELKTAVHALMKGDAD